MALVDVDRFKSIDESLGEDAGDRLQREIATRLAGHVRKGDFLAREEVYSVARRGGDEFLVLIEDVSAPHEAAAAARRILDVLREPFCADGKERRFGRLASPPPSSSSPSVGSCRTTRGQWKYSIDSSPWESDSRSTILERDRRRSTI